MDSFGVAPFSNVNMCELVLVGDSSLKTLFC